jgi:hypothetical protein
VEARRLADEHQVCVRVPDAEDDLGAGLREPAPRAPRHLFAKSVERVHAAESRKAPGQSPSRSRSYRRSSRLPAAPGRC